MRLLFLEPFHGGSHKDFALGLKAHSRHDIDLMTLPDTFWKWRMAAAAYEFLSRIKSLSDYDGIIATDMMNLGDFIVHSRGKKMPPVLLYFHENQLTYPQSSRQKHGIHFPGAVNISSALASNHVVFNSNYHRKAFFSTAKRYHSQCPDMDFSWVMRDIQSKTSVIYPGCWFSSTPLRQPVEKTSPPLIIWNHRWEYDKNPEAFFDALATLENKDIPFRLALMGQRYARVPAVFHRAKKAFHTELIVYDYIDSRKEYHSWLKKGAIVVSTANQENFGISIAEASRMGCVPVVPNRLSYPEIIPKDFHEHCLYDTQAGFVDKLSALLLDTALRQRLSIRISRHMSRYSWDVMAAVYDEKLTTVFQSGRVP